jgi:hypothetical protein
MIDFILFYFGHNNKASTLFFAFQTTKEHIFFISLSRATTHLDDGCKSRKKGRKEEIYVIYGQLFILLCKRVKLSICSRQLF